MITLRRLLAAALAFASVHFASAETIAVSVDAAINDGTMSPWFRPSAFATWSGPVAINDLIADSNGHTLGMVRLSVENELGDSADQADLLTKLNGSTISARIQGVLNAGGTVVLTIAKMPKWLSSSSDITPLNGGYLRYQTMPPAAGSYPAWSGAVQTIVNFFTNTKGFTGIRYEFWNEPDSTDFWGGTEAQFYQTYDAFVSGAIAASAGALVGGPTAVSPRAVWPGTSTLILDAFLSHCSSTSTRLSFVSCHTFTGSPTFNFYLFEEVAAKLAVYGYSSLPLYIDEHTGMDPILSDPSWPSAPSALNRHADSEMAAGFALSFMKYMELLGQPGFQGESLDNHDHPSNSAFPANQFSSRRTNVLYAAGIRKAGYWGYLLPAYMSESLVKVTGITESNSANEYFPHFHAKASKTGDKFYLLLWNYVGMPFLDGLSVTADKGYADADLARWGGTTALRNYFSGAVAVSTLTSDPQEQADLGVAKAHYDRQRTLVTENHSVTLSLANFATNTGTEYKLTRYEIDSDSTNSYYHYIAAGGDAQLSAATAAATANQSLEVVDSRQFAALSSLGSIACKPYMATLLVLERNVAPAAPQVKDPSSYTITAGSLNSGNLSSLAVNDNNYLVVNSTTGLGTKRAKLEFNYTGFSTPTQISVKVAAKVSSARPGYLHLWNYTTSAFEQIAAPSLTTTETTTTVTLTSNVAKYVSAGNLKLQLEVVGSPSFNASIDEAEVTVTP